MNYGPVKQIPSVAVNPTTATMTGRDYLLLALEQLCLERDRLGECLPDRQWVSYPSGRKPQLKTLLSKAGQRERVKVQTITAGQAAEYEQQKFNREVKRGLDKQIGLVQEALE